VFPSKYTYSILACRYQNIIYLTQLQYFYIHSSENAWVGSRQGDPECPGIGKPKISGTVAARGSTSKTHVRCSTIPSNIPGLNKGNSEWRSGHKVKKTDEEPFPCPSDRVRGPFSSPAGDHRNDRYARNYARRGPPSVVFEHLLGPFYEGSVEGLALDGQMVVSPRADVFWKRVVRAEVRLAPLDCRFLKKI
jgi:hypothetical protein